MTRMRRDADNLADNVGEPVTATDDADPTPTYTLGGTDKDMFRIRANGQIEVGAKAMLDYETKSSYTVTVTATDSSGDEANNSASITVTIYVTDLDEAPMISTGGLAVSGPARADYAEDRTDAVATYTASGPDAAQATWSLSGDDAGDFSISSGGELTFSVAPDFEAPADADEDNVYEVTVEADDGTYMDTHDVTVMVTNVEEDGTVTLTADKPMVGEAVTANVTDPDDVTPGTEVWQWARADDAGFTMNVENIAGATMASYTPVEADDGKYLRASVTYTDGYDAGNELAARSENPVSENPVTAGDPLLVRYDADNDECIQLAEARVAVGDYFAPPRGSQLSLEDARKVVGLFFACRGRQSQ